LPSPEGFTEFAVAAAPRLRRTAYLLCGDWHAAQGSAAQGTGPVEMQLSRPGNLQPSNCSAYNPGVLACRSYLLPGGAKVEESMFPAGSTGPARHRYLLGVVEWQPHHGVSGSFTTMNYSIAGHNGKLTAAPPVRMKQLLAAALDPRWGWSMNQGFVAQASHLQLGGQSGKVWH
jgi:hypothetical protein